MTVTDVCESLAKAPTTTPLVKRTRDDALYAVKNKVLHERGNAPTVMWRLVQELQNGIADRDPQAWMREASITMQRLL